MEFLPDGGLDLGNLGIRDRREVRSLWEEVADKAVCVFIQAALPGFRTWAMARLRDLWPSTLTASTQKGKPSCPSHLTNCISGGQRYGFRRLGIESLNHDRAIDCERAFPKLAANRTYRRYSGTDAIGRIEMWRGGCR